MMSSDVIIIMRCYTSNDVLVRGLFFDGFKICNGIENQNSFDLMGIKKKDVLGLGHMHVHIDMLHRA